MCLVGTYDLGLKRYRIPKGGEYCHYYYKNIVQVIRPGAPNVPGKENDLEIQVKVKCNHWNDLEQGQPLTLKLAGVIKCTGLYNLYYVFLSCNGLLGCRHLQIKRSLPVNMQMWSLDTAPWAWLLCSSFWHIFLLSLHRAITKLGRK